MWGNYTIGSDPELFIFNRKTNKVVSAIDKIPGYKDQPFTEGLPEGFGLQTDNILAEFNIPPVNNVKDFIKNTEFMKDFIRQRVQGINTNLDVLCQASSQVPAKELKHPQAREFGCDPDYCIYREGPNEVSAAARTNLRSAGFHVHVGYENHNIDTSMLMLQYIDAYVGIPSIIYDTDAERRKLYGKAGCFRLTKYGFEYRTLSSYWIGSPKRMQFIWNQLMRALNAFEQRCILPDCSLVRDSINNNDIQTANALIETYNLIDPENVIPD
jgi:hypothetical protein